MTRNRAVDPEPAELAADLSAEGVLGDPARRGDSLADSLKPAWPRILPASGQCESRAD